MGQKAYANCDKPEGLFWDDNDDGGSGVGKIYLNETYIRSSVYPITDKILVFLLLLYWQSCYRMCIVNLEVWAVGNYNKMNYKNHVSNSDWSINMNICSNR